MFKWLQTVMPVRTTIEYLVQFMIFLDVRLLYKQIFFLNIFQEAVDIQVDFLSNSVNECRDVNILIFYSTPKDVALHLSTVLKIIVFHPTSPTQCVAKQHHFIFVCLFVFFLCISVNSSFLTAICISFALALIFSWGGTFFCFYVARASLWDVEVGRYKTLFLRGIFYIYGGHSHSRYVQMGEEFKQAFACVQEGRGSKHPFTNAKKS